LAEFLTNPQSNAMLQTELIAAAEPNSRRLMLVLHGLGDSMAGYRWLPPALRIPSLNFLLVNAPTPYFGGYSWYDFAGDPGPGIELSRKHLFTLLDQQREAGFATAQTMLFGFSQGSLLCLDVGLRYPRRLAGIIGISGYVHEPDRLVRELPPAAKTQRLLVTHGTKDALLPIGPTREAISLLQSAGLPIQWREFEKEHTIAGETELHVIRDFVLSCFSDSGPAEFPETKPSGQLN
jgi:phospholipase/carboxylesterase